MKNSGGSKLSVDPIGVRVPEAVRLSGMSRSRVYKLMRSGDIEYAKVGCTTVILLESVKRYIESQRIATDR